MSRMKYFTGTSLYLVRLKIFDWTKFLRRHFHQFLEGNWAGRNFLTVSRKCRTWIQGSLRMQECRDECSLQCKRFLRARKCFCSRKRHVETSRREEEMGRVKGSGKGVGREKRKTSFPSFALTPTLRVTISTLPNLPLSWDQKMAATTIRTRTRFPPPKIRLHCRLRWMWNLQVPTDSTFE